jgi:hypothetical protein
LQADISNQTMIAETAWIESAAVRFGGPLEFQRRPAQVFE